MKKGKLISTIVVCVILIVGGFLLTRKPQVTEHTSNVNIEILEEMKIEGDMRKERIDSLIREVDSLRSTKVEIDSISIDSMLRYLKGIGNG